MARETEHWKTESASSSEMADPADPELTAGLLHVRRDAAGEVCDVGEAEGAGNERGRRVCGAPLPACECLTENTLKTTKH
jgi:hypothetical protein